MGAPAALHALLDQLVDDLGEEGVRRALQFSSMLSLTREASEYDLECAEGAARRVGPYGALVLEVPSSPDDPVEAIWLSRTTVTQRADTTVVPMTKQQRRR